jgi:hypothetical protein
LKESIGGDVITLSTSNDDEAIKLLQNLDGIIDIKKVDNMLRIKVKDGEEMAPKILEKINKKWSKSIKNVNNRTYNG